jgi:signal transduction histidine kinase
LRFNADRSFAGYIGSAIDVTQGKRAEEALSTVSQKLIEAHEEERVKIARELHDDINQRLVLLSINLHDLKQVFHAVAPEVREHLEEVIKAVRDLASDVHRLSHSLHPSKLKYLGLAAAVASFCRELAERQNVQIDFRCEGIPKELPKEISLCLYRVLQEALQNAINHSGSPRLEVSLRGESNQIQLTVRDWGVGFDPAVAMKGRGLGLTSMKERLKLVAGELSVQSEPQRGTAIHASVPLKERREDGSAGS